MRLLILCSALALVSCDQFSNKFLKKAFANQQLEDELPPPPNWSIEPLKNHGDVVVYDIHTYNTKFAKEDNIDLIGGQPAKPEDWPSSFASSQDGSGCTATLLGPQVLQLAAHCVGNGRTAVIKISGTSYSGTCTHHPSYRSDDTADYALCKMDTVIDRPWYEKVAQSQIIQVGSKVTLAGCGCTQSGGGGGAFGVFRTGESTVQTLPTRNNDTVTKGGAALCFGDSGGSAFYVDGQDRWVFGVNSRGNIRDTSYLSSVFTDTAKSWYKSWADSKSVKICGIHADAPKCQGAEEPEPGPSVPPLPDHCLPDYNFLGKCLWGNPRLALTQVEDCRKAHADLFACEEVAERSQVK